MLRRLSATELTKTPSAEAEKKTQSVLTQIDKQSSVKKAVKVTELSGPALQRRRRKFRHNRLVIAQSDMRTSWF